MISGKLNKELLPERLRRVPSVGAPVSRSLIGQTSPLSFQQTNHSSQLAHLVGPDSEGWQAAPSCQRVSGCWRVKACSYFLTTTSDPLATLRPNMAGNKLTGMAREVAEKYRETLVTLTFNDKIRINTLTEIAKEDQKYANVIVDCIEARLRKVS